MVDSDSESIASEESDEFLIQASKKNDSNGVSENPAYKRRSNSLGNSDSTDAKMMKISEIKCEKDLETGAFVKSAGGDDKLEKFDVICQTLDRCCGAGSSIKSTSPTVIQSQGFIFISCTNGTKIKIDSNNSVYISTTTKEIVSINDNGMSIESGNCKLDVKEGVLRIRSDNFNSMLNFSIDDAKVKQETS